jgi:hypothetical protein
VVSTQDALYRRIDLDLSWSKRELPELLRAALARAARSARRTTHFDLDFPRTPERSPYWCHKHRRECRPVGEARRFLRRYALDTLARVREFARVRARGREAVVLHGTLESSTSAAVSTVSSPRRRIRA